MIKEGLRRNGRLAGFEVRISPHYFMGYSRHVPTLRLRRDGARTLPTPGTVGLSPWDIQGESKRRARERWCAHGERAPAPPHARAPRARGRRTAARARRFALTSLPAPFHGSFFCTVCACSLATLERRASQELASKAAHAHPTPIPWSVFSAPAEPGKSVAPRHRCAASSSCRSRRPRRADGA